MAILPRYLLVSAACAAFSVVAPVHASAMALDPVPAASGGDLSPPSPAASDDAPPPAQPGPPDAGTVPHSVGNQSPIAQGDIRQHAPQSPTAPLDPYPLQAAGWGGPAGPDTFITRWIEDWSRLRAEGKALPFKAMPLFNDDVTLTLSGEVRLRLDTYSNAALMPHNNYTQRELRDIIGFDLHLGQHFRVYSELGNGETGGTSGHFVQNYGSTATPASYKNAASVQQLFIEAKTEIDQYLVGGIAGRQEYTDLPRQLLSVSDGPNLHRVWNGVRLYAHGPWFRVGAATLAITTFEPGAFDEEINWLQRLDVVNGSISVLPPGRSDNLFLEPFYVHNYNSHVTVGNVTGLDVRNTFGGRLWGRIDRFSIDWTAAGQSGSHVGRDVDAWFASFIQNYLVQDTGWRIRIGGHIDLASGGDHFNQVGAIHGFYPVYASPNYLGQGLFLYEENLFLIAPGIAFAPVKNVTVTAEVDPVRRLSQTDAVYAFGNLPYKNTQNVKGYDVGTFTRLNLTWVLNRFFTLDSEYNHFASGPVMREAKFGAGDYGMLSLTFRY